MASELTCLCGCVLSVADAHAGLRARCPVCRMLLDVPGEYHPEPAPAPEAPPPPGEITASAATLAVCAACGEPAETSECVFCLSCRAPHHVDCWNDAAGCAVPTCEAGPRSRKRIQRPSLNSRRLRACPTCNQPIPAQAQRCRYCGEFTDLRLRPIRTSAPPIGKLRTSHKAGIALIMALIYGGVLLVGQGSLLILNCCLFLPVGAIILSLIALRDIRRAQGLMAGQEWTAGFTLAISAIDILAWLVYLIP